MGWFSKKKCDVDAMIERIGTTLASEISNTFEITDGQLQLTPHSQGLDILYSFTKKPKITVRKKISYQIKQKDLETGNADALYQEAREGLMKLVQIRLDD